MGYLGTGLVNRVSTGCGSEWVNHTESESRIMKLVTPKNNLTRGHRSNDREIHLIKSGSILGAEWPQFVTCVAYRETEVKRLKLDIYLSWRSYCIGRSLIVNGRRNFSYAMALSKQNPEKRKIFNSKTGNGHLKQNSWSSVNMALDHFSIRGVCHFLLALFPENDLVTEVSCQHS
jgi:hypothetical protein